MSKVYFVFGVHIHQPVGNFPSVFNEAFQKCYYPFFDHLYRFPKVKCNLHISGPLYDWIIDNRPEFIELIKEMVKRGQVEVISGGYYEPILSLISDEDKVSQIEKMNEFIAKTFGIRPKGIWITERVWEPSLAKIINICRLKYTFLDDTHFRYAGLNLEEFFGYYITEADYHSLSIFPISKTLRYKIPFSLAGEAISILKSFKETSQDVLVTLFDDGEKFGVWPFTHEWVYQKRWLEDFFTLLSEQDDIETITAQEAIEKFKPKGLIYLPTASYEEMGEWVLAPDAYAIYEELKGRLKKEKDYELFKNFLRGGFFKNFYFKYPRLNYMHKRMLFLSSTLGEVADRKKDKKIFDFLWKAQCNCGYWHGVFGGFYLPHIRSAIYENLIKAEKLFDNKYTDGFKYKLTDMDFDGHEEIFVGNKNLVCVFSSKGGTLLELSYKDKDFNLLNTITRKRESYHKNIKKEPQKDNKEVVTIHELIQSKDKDLADYLIYDTYEKVSLVDHILDKDITLEDFNKGMKFRTLYSQVYNHSVKKKKQKIDLSFSLRDDTICFTKKITFPYKKGFSVSYEFERNSFFSSFNFGVEFNLFFLSPYDLKINGEDFGLKNYTFENVDELKIQDSFKRIVVEFFFDNADLFVLPVYSVSSSESGFEKVFQQMTILFIKKSNSSGFNLFCSLK